MGEMVTFDAGTAEGRGYLALPEGGGPGVLVLHAWWGLNSFFTGLCDRLAGEGFVALAPDLYDGVTVDTVQAAEAQLKRNDPQALLARAAGGLAALRAHPARRGGSLAALGYSLGAAYAIDLASMPPADVRAAVLFYGAGAADFSASRAAYLGHFAPGDPVEPDEGVREMEADMRAAGREVTIHSYPGASHWFFESDRPEYDASAAALAWERTLAFLRERLAA